LGILLKSTAKRKKTCKEKPGGVMNKKTVMILGAGLMQGPAIKAAKELGFKSFVADANSKAVCAKDADYFAPVDLKDKESLLECARIINSQEKVLAGVFTAGTDFSANAAYVAKKFGLPGHEYDACLNASDKVRMRGCFQKNNIPSPGFEEVDEKRLLQILEDAENGKVKFPKVVKPADNMGGRGCRLVRNKEELKEAVLHAVKFSRTSRAIFEDYMEGPEFSIDAVVYKGTLTITGFADRHIYYPPYFIETGHTMPSVADEKTKNELIATFALGIKTLGLTEGIAKADIKYTQNGPMIGEIAARLSGGYMSGWTFPYSSDCFLTKEALKIAAGLEPSYILENRTPLNWTPHKSVSDREKPFELYELKSVRTSAERAWVSIPGKIASVKGLDEAAESDYVKDVFPRCKEGDSVDFPRNNVEKCGNVLTCAPDYKTAVEAAYKALNKITLVPELNNDRTDAFLEGIEQDDEKNFPPSFFEIDCDLSSASKIPAGKKACGYVPDSIAKVWDNVRDPNHCTLHQAVKRFDELYPDHPELDGVKFWKACLRGSIQAMLYVSSYKDSDRV
jgi:biotin carboxylase